MKIDIIIPAWNMSEWTVACLRSIFASTVVDTRVIYIDNASETQHREAVEKELRPHDIIIRNKKNLGFVKAVNQGLRKSRADFVVIQNNDTEVFPLTYERLVRHFKNAKKTSIVGGMVSKCDSWQSVHNVTTRFPDVRRVFRRHGARNMSPKQLDALFEKEMKDQRVELERGMIAFFLVLIPRTILSKVGLLDERFGVGFGDDDDYCLRTLNAGFGLTLALDVVTFHNHRTTFTEIYGKKGVAELKGEAMKILTTKHPTLTKF